MGEEAPKSPARNGAGGEGVWGMAPWGPGPEAWYRELVERVPAVLYVDASDESSSAIYTSPQSDSMFGYSRGGWLEDPELWVRMLHPEDRERVLAAHDRARRARGPFEEEYRLIARDGSVVWVRDEAVPVDGEPGRRAGVLLDITERKLYEERLRESEERYRELFENAMEGIAKISPEGGVIEQCNPAYARALGLTPGEVVGRSFFEFVDGENETEARRQRDLRLSGAGSEYEVTITAADGEEKVLSCGGYPLHGPDGAYEGAVQTATDVTERRRHEEALKKSEERFQLVAGVTGEAIWDNDLASGAQEWDGATEALFGYPPHRSRTGAWWEERIHPEDRYRVLSGIEAMLDSRGGRWEAEYRFRRADGSYASVLDRGRVVRDGDGRPERMVGAMADVTHRKLNEEELRKSEELFRRTFEAAGVGMAHVAPDGKWLTVNDKLCEILGCTRDKILRMSFRDLTPGEDLEAGEERLRRLLGGRTGPYSIERRFVREDGSRVWVGASVSLVRSASGEPDYVVCVAEDVTERKLEELVPDPLTPKEMVVLRLASEGLSNPQVAERLAYSVHAVKLYLQNIFTKLRLETRTRREAVSRAVDIGLIKPQR